jgi:hypothetical protein
MDNDIDTLLRDAVTQLRPLPEVEPAARERLRRRLAMERMRTRPVVLSRTAVLAAAAAIVALTSLVWAVLVLDLPIGPDGRPTMPVQFVLVAPDANTVSLVGDFNHWDARAAPLRQGDGGVWSVVLPLAKGAFSYSFVVNGDDWRADPMAPTAPDDFGRPSSVVYVSPESMP